MKYYFLKQSNGNVRITDENGNVFCILHPTADIRRSVNGIIISAEKDKLSNYNLIPYV